MAKLRAALTSMDGITPAEKARIEQRFIDRLESGLGGPAAACATYLDWLQYNGKSGIDVDSLTRVIRWEVAHVNAVTHAFSDCDGDSMRAFFIVHVEKDNAAPRAVRQVSRAAR